MNPTDFLQTLAALRGRLLDDPFGGLAFALAWLDPVFNQLTDLDEAWLADVSYAAGICRDCFPDLYAELVQRARAGASEAQLEALLCTAISQRLGVDVGTLEELAFGPPLEAIGLPTGDPEFFETEQFVRERAVLNLFGVTQCYWDDDRAFHRAQSVAEVIADDVQDRDPALAALLRYVFSSTGNTLCDYSWEELAEAGFEPLAWTSDDVTFHQELHADAARIYTQAYEALQRFHNDAALRDDLARNIQHIQANLERNPNEHRLHWTCDAARSAQRRATIDPQIL